MRLLPPLPPLSSLPLSLPSLPLPAGGRSTARDGLANQLEFLLTTNFAPLWEAVQSVPAVRREVNRALIDSAVLKIPTRPNPLSALAPYTSWASLTDRTFSGRHLPPVVPAPAHPPVERVADLFMRRGDATPGPKSTLLFAYFAQWFTDGFLRSDRSEPRDYRRNTSTHDIDLSQLYGLNAHITGMLRSYSAGELKSQHINGEEYPPHLCHDGQRKPEFADLPVFLFDELTPAQRNGLFAMGGDRANSQLGYLALNVLFFREHNRLARLLARQNPGWDDERLFQTARNILVVLLIRIVIEEYINHIAPYFFKFRMDPPAVGNPRWYRPNWMAIEFNLLYRWHSLIPSTLWISGEGVPLQQTFYTTEFLLKRGLGGAFDDASRQSAGQLGLFNTDPALRNVEVASILTGRELGLASYNDYREYARYPRVTAFDQISADPRVQESLREVYGHPDRIEFYVGLFAEDVRPNSVLPSLIGRMVGIDAFSQALTNPLLSARVFNDETFSPAGMEVIRTTRTLGDVVRRNLPPGTPDPLVTMTRRDWRRT